MKTAMTMMTTKTSLLSRLIPALRPPARCCTRRAALAVNDLPGGPAVNQLDLHPPVTKIAAEHQWLHYFMLVICAVIFVGVFGVMFYSIVRHRKSKGHRAANFHESTAVEIIWTVVPFIIVICMALPATKVVVAMKDTTNADLTIKATGIQWKWGYDYLRGEGEGIGFLSTLDTDASRDVGRRQAVGRQLPAEGRQPARRSGEQEGSRRVDRQRCDPRLHGAVVRHQAGRHSRASCATPGFAPRRPATTTANAPSFAARSTPTCRST